MVVYPNLYMVMVICPKLMPASKYSCRYYKVMYPNPCMAIYITVSLYYVSWDFEPCDLDDRKDTNFLSYIHTARG